MTLGLNHLKSHLIPFFAEFNCLNLIEIDNFAKLKVPVMAAIAVRKKVISIGHFSPCFHLQSLQFFFYFQSNQYIQIAFDLIWQISVTEDKSIVKSDQCL